jgi:hypothetical protein
MDIKLPILEDGAQPLARRSLLKGFTYTAATLSLGGLLNVKASATENMDADILGAAKIAEALATTMYTGIIETAPWFQNLEEDDQNYFLAARDEEKYHYDLLKSVTGNTDAQTTYYFPSNMFVSVRKSVDIVVYLEDIFIAAYLFGVRHFSNDDLKVIAAQIMGIESDHRTLARLVAGELGRPVTFGLAGNESVDPPNNNIYERTYGLDSLGKIVQRLLPFLDANAAAAKNYTIVRTFDPSYVPNFPGLKGNPPA